MANKQIFLSLVTDTDTSIIADAKNRVKNRAMLEESQKIALKVLVKLDELQWSQKDLAKKMEVSPQQVNKILSGTQNLTIETQIKLQSLLDLPILASYYEQKKKEKKSTGIKFKRAQLYVPSIGSSSYQKTCRVVTMKQKLVAHGHSDYTYLKAK